MLMTTSLLWQSLLRLGVRVVAGMWDVFWWTVVTMYWLLVTTAWLLAWPIVLTFLALGLTCLVVLDSINAKPFTLNKMLSFSARMWRLLRRRISRQVRAIRVRNS